MGQMQTVVRIRCMRFPIPASNVRCVVKICAVVSGKHQYPSHVLGVSPRLSDDRLRTAAFPHQLPSCAKKTEERKPSDSGTIWLLGTSAV